ncbi:hypothetical protein CYMTET_27304, partial [Cymbomonas tetramitiformis]
GVDEGDTAAQWFSTYLNRECRLVRHAGRRPTDPKYADGFETGFADGFGFLLASTSSLEDLNKRYDEKILMNRFRPNIVVSGAPPWAEDSWAGMEIQPNGKEGTPIPLLSVKPCSRCQMPCIEQETAIKGKEPTELLKKLRSGRRLKTAKESWETEVFFGWNLVCPASNLSPEKSQELYGQSGIICRVGDVLQVTNTRELFP